MSVENTASGAVVFKGAEVFVGVASVFTLTDSQGRAIAVGDTGTNMPPGEGLVHLFFN